MMNNEEIEAAKNKMIDSLKSDIKSDLLDSFVEGYKEWKEKMKTVNNVIQTVDPLIEIYIYDEFCKKISEITERCLETMVNYENLFLTELEFEKILKNNNNDEIKAEIDMINEINDKFFNNLMFFLHKEHLKQTIKYKLKESFPDIAEDLEKSVEVAQLILNKFK